MATRKQLAAIPLTLQAVRCLEPGAILRLHHVDGGYVVNKFFVGLEKNGLLLRTLHLRNDDFFDGHTEYDFYELGLAPDEDGKWSSNYLMLRDMALGCVEVLLR